MKEGGNKGQAVPPSVFIKENSDQIKLFMLRHKNKKIRTVEEDNG